MDIIQEVNSSFNDITPGSVLPLLNLTSSKYPLDNLTKSSSFENSQQQWLYSDILITTTTIYLLTLTTFLVTRSLTKCPSVLRDVLQIFFVNSTLILLSPLLLSLYSILLLYRAILTLYFKWILQDKLTLMDSTDVAWAFESHAECNNFTSLYILQGNCDEKKIQDRILHKLVRMRDDVTDHFVYEKLGWCAKKKFGFYCWEKSGEDQFDVTQHVRLVNGHEGKEEFSEKDIFDEISRTADEPMTSDRPQWEILMVPNFKYNENELNKVKYYALIFRVHHSIMDGVSAGHVLKYALADKPVALSVDPLKPPKVNIFLKYLMYLKAVVAGPSKLLTSMTVDENNCFHKKPVSGPKNFAWTRPVRMDTLKAIKFKTKTTTTAVLISSIGGAIRSLAVKRGLTVPGKILAAPTVALLPYPDTRPRNRFVLMHYPLDIGLGSPGERLDFAHQTALGLAEAPDPLFNFTVVKIGGRLPAFIADFLMGVLHATFIFSNVPGPKETAYLFGGHPLMDAVFWVPIKNCTGIGACTFSYDGRIRAAFVSDKSCLTDDEDVTQLVKGFEQEITTLATSAGVKEDQVFWISSSI